MHTLTNPGFYVTLCVGLVGASEAFAIHSNVPYPIQATLCGAWVVLAVIATRMSAEWN